MAKPDPTHWSYEQFVQAVQGGTVKSVFVVNGRTQGDDIAVAGQSYQNFGQFQSRLA
jgi:hypothetical protein